ncbi:MAG: acyl carrier protein [Erythrobacter sp.]
MKANQQQVQTWMVDYLAKLLMLDRARIDVTDTFESYGLDSAAMVGMTGDLSDWAGIEIDPVIAYDYPTIAALSSQVVALLGGTARQAGTQVAADAVGAD